MTVAEDGTLIGWDLDGAAGFGSSYPGLGERWISNRVEAVEPGKLVVAPARSLVRSLETVEEVPLDAVFLDPRTGEEVATVPVGKTGAQSFFGSSVAVSPDARLVAVTAVPEGLELVTTPVSPFLSPGRYAAYAADVPGLPPRPSTGTERVTASVLLDGALHVVDRIDERAATMWIERDGSVVPIALSGIGPDLVRYAVVA